MKKGEIEISIVTGASSGLGKEIAKLLCEKGHRVYSVARRKNLLRDLKNECSNFRGEIKIADGDLTQKGFRENLVKRILKESGKIDYLINNAGYGKLSGFENIEFKDIEGMFALNCIAGQHLCQLVLPFMRKENEGKIINVASVVAFVPPPYFSVYNSTKSAVYNFTRSLTFELVNSGVYASVLFPARMDTPFWKIAFKCKGLKDEEQKKCVIEHTKGSTKPKKVAKYLVKHLDSKNLVLLPGFLPKLYYYLVSNTPFLNNFVAKYITGPKTKKILKKI